jgi:hypothetical protein
MHASISRPTCARAMRPLEDARTISKRGLTRAWWWYRADYFKRKGADESLTNHAGKTCYDMEATLLR